MRWLTDDTPLALGQVALHWEPAPTGWNVQAHLGLATGPVRLATWPNSPDHWPDITRPTLHEVRSLCSALRVATRALNHSLALPT
ncbi:esterase [Streptomyces sp. LBUM 1476]|nr:esterase [Streptomyces sp. LBUM 1476]MBZ3915268.1 esterase [Streptomyces acidiscabies]